MRFPKCDDVRHFAECRGLRILAVCLLLISDGPHGWFEAWLAARFGVSLASELERKIAPLQWIHSLYEYYLDWSHGRRADDLMLPDAMVRAMRGIRWGSC